MSKTRKKGAKRRRIGWLQCVMHVFKITWYHCECNLCSIHLCAKWTTKWTNQFSCELVQSLYELVVLLRYGFYCVRNLGCVWFDRKSIRLLIALNLHMENYALCCSQADTSRYAWYSWNI